MPLDAPFIFGMTGTLRTQVAELRATGATWEACGSVLGWDPETVQRYYEHTIVIWLDDQRDPYDLHWRRWICDRFDGGPWWVPVWIKDPQAFMPTVQKVWATGIPIQAVCFDNDLGQVFLPDGRRYEGRHCFAELEKWVRENEIPPFKLLFQSSNAPAVREMSAGAESLRRWWAR